MEDGTPVGCAQYVRSGETGLTRTSERKPPPPPPGRALENQYLKAHVVRLFAVDFVMEPLSPSSSAMILSEMLTGLFWCEQIALTELREI